MLIIQIYKLDSLSWSLSPGASRLVWSSIMANSVTSSVTVQVSMERCLDLWQEHSCSWLWLSLLSLPKRDTWVFGESFYKKDNGWQLLCLVACDNKVKNIAMWSYWNCLYFRKTTNPYNRRLSAFDEEFFDFSETGLSCSVYFSNKLDVFCFVFVFLKKDFKICTFNIFKFFSPGDHNFGATGTYTSQDSRQHL